MLYITYLSSHSPCPQPGYVCLPLISICTTGACIQRYLVKLALEVGSDLVGKIIVASWGGGERWGVGRLLNYANIIIRLDNPLTHQLVEIWSATLRPARGDPLVVLLCCLGDPIQRPTRSSLRLAALPKWPQRCLRSSS